MFPKSFSTQNPANPTPSSAPRYSDTRRDPVPQPPHPKTHLPPPPIRCPPTPEPSKRGQVPKPPKKRPVPKTIRIFKTGTGPKASEKNLQNGDRSQSLRKKQPAPKTTRGSDLKFNFRSPEKVARIQLCACRPTPITASKSDDVFTNRFVTDDLFQGR
jgi:hypothetical protein